MDQQLIDRLYECSFAPEFWPGVLDELATQFNDTALANSLTAHHLEYVHMQALGGLRHARKDSPNTGWRNGSFRSVCAAYR
jgi:hypothetical protein